MVLLKRVEDRSNTIKAQQKELVEAGKLASLGEVIAGISHEVNNPLAIILGYTGQLKTLLSKHIGHGRFINEILPAIESGVERIRLIINQLNAFSGMYTLEAPSHQKLAPLINNAIHNQNERIVAQSCRVEVPAYLGDVDVYGKTDYLKQIFDIMLGNALDATALASAKWIKIDTVTTQQHLLIRFSNSGTTITVTPSAVSPHDSAKMTAIGLVIARRLAEDQNIELYMDRDEQQIYLVLKLPR